MALVRIFMAIWPLQHFPNQLCHKNYYLNFAFIYSTKKSGNKDKDYEHKNF
jgi:hypothetical protein